MNFNVPLEFWIFQPVDPPSITLFVSLKTGNKRLYDPSTIKLFKLYVKLFVLSRYVIAGYPGFELVEIFQSVFSTKLEYPPAV